MKQGYLFIALLFTVFMFPFAGNVSNADAIQMGDMDCVKAGNPTEVAACWNAKAHKGPPPGSMPSMGMPATGAQPVLPPTGGVPTAAMPPADPCMAVTDPNDIVTCRASHPVAGMGMPPMGMPPRR